MKKIICIFLAALFLVSVAVSCADNKADGQTTANTSEATASSAESSSPEESTSEAESTVEPENTESTSTQAATEAVVTQPPVTEPAEVTQATTEAIVTTPPVTTPPETDPPETTPPALVIPENGSEMGESLYDDPFASTEFTSINELYAYIKNMSKQEFDNILANEQKYLWDTAQKSHISNEELQYGIYGYLKNSVLTSKAIIVPRLSKEYAKNGVFTSIRLESDYFNRKPWIKYSYSDSMWIDIMMFDPALADEAKGKGASWLIGKLSPEQMNVHNYETLLNGALSEGITAISTTKVYEKEFALGNRNVMALVYDNSSAEIGKGRYVQVYFVYEGILVSVTGQPEDIYEALPGLTFEEVKIEG